MNLDNLIKSLQEEGFLVTGMHLGPKGEKGTLSLANRSLNPDEKQAIREILDRYQMKHAYLSSKRENITIEFPIL